jgi:purine nucleoside permease
MEVEFVDLRALNKADEAWFYREFVQGFMDAYADKTFFIMESGDSPKLLGPTNLKEKQEWLLQLAREFFRDYVLSEKENYKAFKITYNHEPAGAILYHIDADHEKGDTIYLHLLFVCISFQKRV